VSNIITIEFVFIYLIPFIFILSIFGFTLFFFYVFLCFFLIIALHKENMSLWCAVCLNMLRASRNACIHWSMPLEYLPLAYLGHFTAEFLPCSLVSVSFSFVMNNSISSVSWFMVIFVGFAALASSARVCFSFLANLKTIPNMSSEEDAWFVSLSAIRFFLFFSSVLSSSCLMRKVSECSRQCLAFEAFARIRGLIDWAIYRFYQLIDLLILSTCRFYRLSCLAARIPLSSYLPTWQSLRHRYAYRYT